MLQTICNKCGSVVTRKAKVGKEKQEQIVPWVVMIRDGRHFSANTEEFDLCDHCKLELMSSLKHPPQQKKDC